MGLLGSGEVWSKVLQSPCSLEPMICQPLLGSSVWHFPLRVWVGPRSISGRHWLPHLITPYSPGSTSSELTNGVLMSEGEST